MTECEICNLALLKLGQTALESLDDKDNPYAPVLCGLLPFRHASLLERADWVFATFTETLAPLTTLRHGKRCSLLPRGFLRTLSPRNLKRDGDLILFPDGLSVLELTYLKMIPVEQASSLYGEALACSLAVELCVRVRESEVYRERLKLDFEEAYEKALVDNSINLSKESLVFYD